MNPKHNYSSLNTVSNMTGLSQVQRTKRLLFAVCADQTSQLHVQGYTTSDAIQRGKNTNSACAKLKVKIHTFKSSTSKEVDDRNRLEEDALKEETSKADKRGSI